MGTDEIYLIGDDGDLVTMTDQPYESEGLLQRLLAEHPDVLAGSQIDSQSPRKWLLVAREVGVPKEEGGGDQWSLDHLFLDQDGIPTLVEVKRSTDTRIRRGVVGQMLDYAANGVRYWPVQELRERFQRTHSASERPPEAILSEAFGIDVDPDEYWDRVANNLQSGRIRMVFVADRIPPELQRIVEFLNEQMVRAEVIAVEVKQYVGENLRTLVPRVIGLTASAQQTKQRIPRKSLAELLAEAPDHVREVEQRLAAWAKEKGFVSEDTRASRQVRSVEGETLLVFWPGYQTVQMNLDPMRQRGFETEAEYAWKALCDLTGRQLTDMSPVVPCDSVASRWDKFEAILEHYSRPWLGR